MKTIFIILSIIGCFATLKGSKILAIFPMPVRSHYILGESLLRGLVKNGHHVTMISPFELSEPIANYSHVKIEGTESITKMYTSKILNIHIPGWQKIMKSIDLVTLLFHTVHNSTNVKRFVSKGKNYDLCIASFMMIESIYGICDAVRAPTIGFSMIGLSSLLTYHTNNPVPYANVPNPFLAYSDEMTFIQRVVNTITWISFDAFSKFVSVPYQVSLAKQYYPNAPPLEEMIENVDLYLLNSHISTESPKALLPNIIPIGGFHLQIMNDISKELKNFLDNSKNGVIYFNLGTNVKSSDLDETIIQILLKTFEKLDYDVLWKYEDVLPNKPKNVRIEKWLPQRPILMHPKIKLFMTHGGLGGITEAIYGGVPMICMPIFGDQEKNCAESVQKGYAVLLKLATINEVALLKSVREIETNPSYKERIMLKSDLYRNQEINPMKKAIFWIEHVIRHKGAKHLKSTVSALKWYKYYLLDVITFLSLFILCTYFVVKWFIKLNLILIRLIIRTSVNICIKKKVKLQ